MAELKDFIAGVDAEEVSAQGDAEESVWLYDKYRKDESDGKKNKDVHGTIVRNWLRTHDGETLVNYERGLKAFLQNKKTPGTNYDLPAIKKNDPGLYAQLEALGCLSVNHEAVEAHRAELGAIKRYELPAGQTQSLQVVKVKE